MRLAILAITVLACSVAHAQRPVRQHRQVIRQPYGAQFTPVMPLRQIQTYSPGAFRTYGYAGSAPMYSSPPFGSAQSPRGDYPYLRGSVTLHSLGNQFGASYDDGYGVILHSLGDQYGASYYSP